MNVEFFDLTIIIPTCNRSILLKDCLESIRAQKPLPQKIIVVDQSDDNLSEALCSKYPNITYTKLAIKNKSLAVNEQFPKCKTKYVSIIDDDCILHSSWLYVARRSFENTKFRVIQGRIIGGEPEGNSVNSRLNDIECARKIFKRTFITPIFKIGCNFLFELSVVDEVGCFDKDFGPGAIYKSSDDNEWGYRLLRKGINVLYEPELALIHRSWRNREQDLTLMSDYGYAAAGFLRKIKSDSKVDFLYHYFIIKKWLLTKIISSSQTTGRSFKIYNKMFERGLREYDLHII